MDFKARGLSTIFFAEAKLSSKEWQELELFVESVNYQRNKNSEKVGSKKSIFLLTTYSRSDS